MISEYAFYLEHEPVTVPASYLIPPVLTFDPRTKRWRLEVSYFYEGPGFILTVPSGFEFDLASIPRAVWWAIAPFELSIVAPLIHDFLYDHGGQLPVPAVRPYRTFTRRESDFLFLEIMRREGISEPKCRIAFNAVRAAGWMAWRGNVVATEERNLQLLPV